jgi:hypothetical protein
VSQENVKIVRRLLEACNRREFDAMLETGDPEIDIVTLMGGTYRGHAGWRLLVEQMAEEVSGFQFVPEDLIDVAVTRWVGTGRTSGIALSQTIGLVYTFRDSATGGHADEMDRRVSWVTATRSAAWSIAASASLLAFAGTTTPPSLVSLGRCSRRLSAATSCRVPSSTDAVSSALTSTSSLVSDQLFHDSSRRSKWIVASRMRIRSGGGSGMGGILAALAKALVVADGGR